MMKLLLSFLLLLLILVGCSKEQSTDIEEILETCEVELLFSPHGLGDDGYNDLSLFGISQAQQAFGFALKIHNPKSIQEGWEYFEAWNQSDSQSKRLFVFCSNDYEALLRETDLSTNSNSTILVYETEEELNGAISFKIEGYGAAYCIGQLASQVSLSAAALLANPNDKNITSIAQGFADGYGQAKDIEVPFYYLAEESNNGYSMKDEAYKLVAELYRNHDFIYPIAGKSNQGVYKYTREYGGTIYTAGIDNNMEAYSNVLLCSLVKRIDLLLYKYVATWSEGKEKIEPYRHFLLPDGYAEVVISSDYKDFFGETPSEEILSTAITKEAEYVKE